MLPRGARKRPHSAKAASCPLYPRKRTLVECSRMSALCQKRTSFSQRVEAINRSAVVEDSYKHVARFRRCVSAVGRDLTGDAAAILRDDFTECVALNGELLPGYDFVLQLDQQLNEPTTAREHRVSAVADKETCVLAGASHRSGDDAVVLKDVHGPFHE